MNCQSIREQLPEMASGRLDAGAAETVRAHLAACPACQREFDSLAQAVAALDAAPAERPSSLLRSRVRAMIAAEKAATVLPLQRHRPSRQIRGFLQFLAAGSLVAVGFVAGTHSRPAVDPDARREIADLRTKLNSMGQFVGYSPVRQEQESANDRLAGVLGDAARPASDEKAIDDLIGALALDPSANVRLGALDALYAHAGQKAVRSGVLTSLPREPNPLVQVAMIDFLTAIRDTDATPALEKLSLNAGADSNVREAAQRALTQL